MQIECPGCAKSYHIIKAALGPNGRRVACPRCDSIWFVAAEGVSIASALPATIEIAGQDIRAEPRRPAAKPPVRRANPRLAPLPRPRSSLARTLGAGMALLAMSMALIGLRARIVTLWPQTDAAYAALGLPVNLRGLELRGLSTLSSYEGAEPVLGIEGEIVNVGARQTEVPPVELTIRDKQGEVLYSWTALSRRHWLAAGESVEFQARLVAPPPEGAEVLAQFAPDEPETLASR